MLNQITQVHNTSSEDLKNEIVTDVVAKMKKELQFFTEKLTSPTPRQNPPKIQRTFFPS